MYCPRCGTANPDGARFCLKCGVGLQPAGQPGQTVLPAEQQAAPPAPPLFMVEYAGFWKRLAAIIIDGLILGVASAFLYFIAFLGLGIFGISVYLLSLVAGWLYFALMESSRLEGTLGKMALGIIVTDMEGRRISFGKATGRYFGKIISAIILYIGFLMIAFTQKKQGLHDMLANCLVIRKG